MTRGAYEFCGAAVGDEAVDGDGMTPLFSAIAFEAADPWTQGTPCGHTLPGTYKRRVHFEIVESGGYKRPNKAVLITWYYLTLWVEWKNWKNYSKLSQAQE